MDLTTEKHLLIVFLVEKKTISQTMKLDGKESINTTQPTFSGSGALLATNCRSVLQEPLEKTFEIYNELNIDRSHFTSRDDICTPMELVRLMLDYVPQELWSRKGLKILDPCCGNGNFGAYCRFKTNIDNIYFNDISAKRIANCKALLNPHHVTIADALSNSDTGQYDLIMANPPYSGGGNKNRSLSNLFIERSISQLKDKGYLCFVTPNNWMTYNNNNTTLKSLLSNGSFIVIDNDIKRFFPTVGSSFTVFVWQKGVFGHKTKVVNSFLIKDIQLVTIPNSLPFIPLYLSDEIISITQQLIDTNPNKFKYRCDLHNSTYRHKLSDVQDAVFKYRTIHTPRKTRYAAIKQDVYDKWLIIMPLSTYFVPYIATQTNVTQSVGYIEFDTEIQARQYIKNITQPHIKLLVHLTRYGNFNNIMVLKHLMFDKGVSFSAREQSKIDELIKCVRY